MEQLTAATQHLKPERSNLASDLVAGLTFAVVNVPQAMGHSVLAAINPVFGIYTLMVAAPVGALFTGSVFMNVSTTSALAVATGAGLSGVAPSQRMEALVALVLLAGAIQVVAGLFRLGFLLRFVSNAVMTGFLNGIAVLIILGQLNDLTGFTSNYRNGVLRTLELLLNLERIDPATTTAGVVTLLLIVGLLLTRLKRFAFIIAVAAATILLAAVTAAPSAMANLFGAVQIVGDMTTIPRSLPQMVLPSPGWYWPMFVPALSVAIIGLIQGAGVSQGTPNPNGKFPNVSRDFLGQGMANLATSVVGGPPAGGSISGTALNIGAGARSRWTNIFGGLFVALIVLLFAPLVERVPMPALAALLIVAGYQGLRVSQALVVWHTGRVTATVMVMTFIATLAISLHYAVLLGVAFSIVLHVVRASNKVTLTEWELQPNGFPIEQPAPLLAPSRRFTLLNVYGSLFFAAASNLEAMLPKVEASNRAVVAIILRGETEIGSTFVNVIQRYAEALRARDGRLMLVGVDPAVRDQLDRTGLLAILGAENIFMATPQLGAAVNEAAEEASRWLAAA